MGCECKLIKDFQYKNRDIFIYIQDIGNLQYKVIMYPTVDSYEDSVYSTPVIKTITVKDKKNVEKELNIMANCVRRSFRCWRRQLLKTSADYDSEDGCVTKYILPKYRMLKDTEEKMK